MALREKPSSLLTNTIFLGFKSLCISIPPREWQASTIPTIIFISSTASLSLTKINFLLYQIKQFTSPPKQSSITIWTQKLSSKTPSILKIFFWQDKCCITLISLLTSSTCCLIIKLLFNIDLHTYSMPVAISIVNTKESSPRISLTSRPEM